MQHYVPYYKIVLATIIDIFYNVLNDNVQNVACSDEPAENY